VIIFHVCVSDVVYKAGLCGRGGWGNTRQEDHAPQGHLVWRHQRDRQPEHSCNRSKGPRIFQVGVILYIYYYFALFFISPKHLVLRVSYCDRPLSVFRRRPSTFLLKHLLLWNRSLDFDQTLQEWFLNVSLPKLFKPFQLVAYVGHSVKK